MLGFGQQAGIIALSGNVNWRTRFAGHQQRLVAILFGASLFIDAGGQITLAAIASAENVHPDAAHPERTSQRDSQRRLARAAGGEIADAHDRIAQALCRPQEAQLAEGESHPVERIERNKKAARGGIVHTRSSLLWFAGSVREKTGGIRV
jgi:hypothetical protein